MLYFSYRRQAIRRAWGISPKQSRELDETFRKQRKESEMLNLLNRLSWAGYAFNSISELNEEITRRIADAEGLPASAVENWDASFKAPLFKSELNLMLKGF